MKVLAPITVSDAVLTSSVVAEDDYAVWNGATTYGLGAAFRVIYGHRCYESLQAGNTNHTPPASGSDTWWLNLGPTNRWAMFDNSVDTSTNYVGTLSVTLTPGGIVNSIGLVSAVGYTARVRMFSGSAVVYDKTLFVDSTPIYDWEDYFFSTAVLPTELIFDRLPRYVTATVQIDITPLPGGSVSVGACLIGDMQEIGPALLGGSAGITDYSRKDTNDFGVSTIVKRGFSKRSTQQIVISDGERRRVSALLTGLRATPSLWIGANDTKRFAPLVVFGIWKNWNVELSYRTHDVLSLEIEGLK